MNRLGADSVTRMIGCLDDETIDALLRGDGHPSLRSARHHLLECEICQELVALATPKVELASGDLIADRYRIDSEIGRGGMGIVYRAWDTKLERALAVKVLHSADPAAHARMNAEAQALARLSHPNIVTVFDVAVSDGRVCMVMELVTGASLRAWLATKPSLSAIVEALHKAGEGLSAAHRAGLVHRDFKPENVMVSADGQVKVCDFGLAKIDVVPEMVSGTRAINRDDMPIHRMTRTGMMVGTPAYMAPEQLAGEEASERSDQFAFAVCAWEVLFSAHPFAAETLGVLRRNFERGPRGASVSGLAPLRRVLERALERRAERRHETMAPILAALRGANPGGSFARWIAIGAVSVVLLAGSAAFALGALRAPPGVTNEAAAPTAIETRVSVPATTQAGVSAVVTSPAASTEPLAPPASASVRAASSPPAIRHPKPAPAAPRDSAGKTTPRVSTGPNGAPLIK